MVRPASSRSALLLGALLAACASPDPVPWSPGDRGGVGEASAAAPADDRPVLDLSGALAPAGGVPRAEARGWVPGADGGDAAVAEVDGAPVMASEVARFLFRYNPQHALDGLNEVLNIRMIRADAAAAGVVVPPGVAEALARSVVRDQENEIRVQFGSSMSLDRYLRERFGFTEASFRRDVEITARLQALRDRLVRYEAMRENRIRFRVLALPDEAAAREAARRLREGADFTALARQVSLVPPGEPLSYRREDVEPRELAAELFSMAAGEVSRPVRVVQAGREYFEVFKVIEVLPARDLPYAAAAEAVEAGLRERPVAPEEYLQWARRARERHGVRFFLEAPAGAGGDGGEEGGGR